MQITRRVALLILIQELLVVAQQLVADGRRLVIGCVVAHVGEDAACKVDVPAPSLGLIVPLILRQATTLDDLPIQAKNIQRGVVAAVQTAYINHAIHKVTSGAAVMKQHKGSRISMTSAEYLS